MPENYFDDSFKNQESQSLDILVVYPITMQSGGGVSVTFIHLERVRHEWNSAMNGTRLN